MVRDFFALLNNTSPPIPLAKIIIILKIRKVSELFSYFCIQSIEKESNMVYKLTREQLSDIVSDAVTNAIKSLENIEVVDESVTQSPMPSKASKTLRLSMILQPKILRLKLENSLRSNIKRR